jgi:MFS family permease
MFPPLLRGKGFGLLYFSGKLGGTLGSLLAVSLVGSTVFGIVGWRFAFYLVAAVSLFTGLLVLLLGKETQAKTSSRPISWQTAKEDMREVSKVASFRVIIGQGIFGSMPWVAMSFFVMWLELQGFSTKEAASIRLAFDLTRSFGMLWGGVIGDAARKWRPDHGYAYAAQFSVGIGIPLWILILYGLPSAKASVTTYVCVAAITGGLISWCGSINACIMSSVIGAHGRTTIFALDSVLEGMFASVAAPLVGVLAEAFGYHAQGEDASNAAALTPAFATLLIVPWVICFLAYTALHWTYSGDRSRVAEEKAEEMEGFAEGSAGNAPRTDDRSVKSNDKDDFVSRDESVIDDEYQSLEQGYLRRVREPGAGS